MSFPLALLTMVFERLFGYPAFLQKRWGHPVQWIGALIDMLEKRLNISSRTNTQRKTAGVFSLFVVLSIVGVVSSFGVMALHYVPFGWVAEAVVASTLLAQTQLGRMVKEVGIALRKSIEEGRIAVSHIVGRDTKALDEPEVSRAAIETLAENASDGVFAPLFWLLLLGLPGIALYKAINTADSMVGHMNTRYQDFGWASAKLDDVVNWIPARLSALLFMVAAVFVPKASAMIALKTVLRDARKHKSPNAGWPEAAVAGALGFGLGGPRNYKGVLLDLPSMGDGKRNLAPDDIDRALRLYNTSLVLAAIGLLVGTFFSLR